MADSIVVLSVFVFAWFWLSGSGLAAWVAAQKNRGAVSWFFASLLISPVLCLVALAAVPPRREDFATERRR